MSVILYEYKEFEGVYDELVNIPKLENIVMNNTYVKKYNSNPMPSSMKYKFEGVLGRLLWYMYVANRVAYSLQYQENEDIFTPEETAEKYTIEEAKQKFGSFMYNIYTNNGTVFLSKDWIGLAQDVNYFLKHKMEAGGTLPTPFGQAGLVGETGTMNEMDLFAMGGGLPQGVHQYYANTYNPAYPTPHGYAKGGKIRKSPFKVGDMVYSYQNPNDKMRVSFVEDRGVEDGVDYGWGYKVALKTDENGKYDPKGKYSQSSKWMSQNSVSKTKKTKYAKGGSVEFETRKKFKLTPIGDIAFVFDSKSRRKGKRILVSDVDIIQSNRHKISEADNKRLMKAMRKKGSDLLTDGTRFYTTFGTDIGEIKHPQFEKELEIDRELGEIDFEKGGITIYAKGGMISVDSKNIKDIHKKYKNVSQLENGQTYAIIDGQNFNIFKDDKLKVSNNRVVGIKKPSYITGKMAKGGLTYMPKESGMVDYFTKKPILKDERWVVYFKDKGKPISSSIKIAKSLRGAERINSRLVRSEEFNNNDYTLQMQSMDSFYKEYPNLFAKGGKTQGYNDKLDESLGNTKGKRSTKEQNYKDRRNESEAMEKKGGKRKYASVKTMDKGNRKKRQTPMSLAKEIRKEGEKWQDAVKRASAMLKKK